MADKPFTVDLTEHGLTVKVTGCAVCGALVGIEFAPGPSIDNWDLHRKWHMAKSREVWHGKS